MKRVRSLICVLLVLVMLGNIVSLAMAKQMEGDNESRYGKVSRRTSYYNGST